MSEMKRSLKVFLYHAPSDKDAVRDLYLRLIQDGVDTRLVKDKLLPSQDWKQEIQGAIREADVVVVCLSEQFNHQGESRQWEARVAFDSVVEQLEDEILVVVARLDECDRLDNLGQWPWVDLFEADGYEALLRALQARADRIGANIQRKESFLPQDAPAGVEPGKALSEEQAVEVTGGILIEGSGVLIDQPVVKLQRARSRRRWGRALLVALIGLTGILVLTVRGSPQLARWYQISLAALSGEIPGSANGIVSEPTSKPAPSNIVFLIDTTSSMQGQRIGIVKSAVSDFISLLEESYRVSVITFDRHVELQMDLTHDHAAARQAMSSMTIGPEPDNSCIYDALYAGIQETSLVPIIKGTKNIIVLLTDIAPGENVGKNCSAHSPADVHDLRVKHPVSIFVVKVGDWNSLDVMKLMIGDAGGIFFSPDDKRELDHALLLVADQAALTLNTESITPASMPAKATGARREPMVFVPSGEFIMGSNRVTLDAFWIDKTEVTNAMYVQCVQAGTCSPPHSKSSRTRKSYYGSSLFGLYPVIFVSWMDADKYCFWAGERLPTEAEWEKAARGTYGNLFPWGDDDPSGMSGLLNYQAEDTVQVGTYPSGASPYGALDMAGNVGEWVADWFSVDYYNHLPASNPTGPSSGEYRVWRGGSWANTSTESILTYHRTGNLPTDYSAGVGFRCARGADQ